MDKEEKVEFKPFKGLEYSEEEMIQRSKEFYEFMNLRRSVREFSDKPVPKEVVENIIRAASTAPSGANKQPWTFCVVSRAELKTKLRKLAEQEEYLNYHGRMSESWLKDLKPLRTDYQKPFIEIAPYLIIVFKKIYDFLPDGERANNYYVNESVGLATGMLLAAIHNAGLVALTHTPSPMNFLEKLLERPSNERAFLHIPIGYPAEDAEVPDIQRKPLEDIAKFYD